MELKKWLQSSTDPATVSNTVRGAVLSAASIIILGAQVLFQLPLSAEQIAAFAGTVGTAAGALWVLFGIGMKVAVFFGKR